LSSGLLAPVVVYDKNGIRILLHFGKDRPRPDVQVMAVSTMSTNTSPIKNLSFQAAVPKVCIVIETSLFIYNEFCPQGAKDKNKINKWLTLAQNISSISFLDMRRELHRRYR